MISQPRNFLFWNFKPTPKTIPQLFPTTYWFFPPLIIYLSSKFIQNSTFRDSESVDRNEKSTPEVFDRIQDKSTSGGKAQWKCNYCYCKEIWSFAGTDLFLEKKIWWFELRIAPFSIKQKHNTNINTKEHELPLRNTETQINQSTWL